MTPELRQVLTALREKPKYSYATVEHGELLRQGFITGQLNEVNCVTWTLTEQGRRALAEAEEEKG